MVFCIVDMIADRVVGHALGHQRNNGDDGSCFKVDVGIVPVFAEQDVIVEMRKVGSKLANGISAGCLYYFFTH